MDQPAAPTSPTVTRTDRNPVRMGHHSVQTAGPDGERTAVNLILVTPHEVDDAGDVTLSGTRASHLLNVLKVAPGRSVQVGQLDGPLGTATVTSTTDDGPDASLRVRNGIPSRPSVDLLLALPRPKVMRRLWAQIAALGVGQVILTNAARVERHYFDTHVLDEARLPAAPD